MPASPYPLPIDLELMPAPACLGLGTAHYIFPSCTEENMQVRTACPAVMTDGSDPLGVAMDEHRGAFYLASVWQRPVSRVQAAPAGVTAGEEAAVGMPSYLALVSG